MAKVVDLINALTVQRQYDVTACYSRKDEGMKVWVVKVGEQLPIGSNIRKMRALQLRGSPNEGTRSRWTSAFNHFQKAGILIRIPSLSRRKISP